MIVYLDSSCGVAMMKEEARTASIRAYVDDLITDGHLVVSGEIFETELRRTGWRLGLPQTQAEQVIAAVTVVEHESIDFTRAGRITAPNLGSLDGLHLATAQRAQAMAMLTFDARLESAAEAVGIPVLDVTRPRTLH